MQEANASPVAAAGPVAAAPAAPVPAAALPAAAQPAKKPAKRGGLGADELAGPVARSAAADSLAAGDAVEVKPLAAGMLNTWLPATVLQVRQYSAAPELLVQSAAGANLVYIMNRSRIHI